MTARIFLILAAFLPCALLPCGGASAQKGVRPLRLLETGDFHGDEVAARSGERWLGLFPSVGGFTLRHAVLDVVNVHDPVVDDPTERTGKRVSVGRAGQPVFLLKGGHGLRPGVVKTVFKGEEQLGNAEIVRLRLGERDYQLRVVSDDPDPADHLKQNSRLILTSGKESQVLFVARTHDDASWSLLWAGDLDGDGKLDLYADLNRHYNTSERRLFLSTKTARRKLVREVATFSVVGC